MGKTDEFCNSEIAKLRLVRSSKCPLIRNRSCTSGSCPAFPNLSSMVMPALRSIGRNNSPTEARGELPYIREATHMSIKVVLFVGIALILFLSPFLFAQAPYDLPNDDNGCPGNCRQIPWRAGSDLWNGGVLPVYTPVTCSGLHADGVTNDGPAIQACINNAAAQTAVFIPPGVYYVNNALAMRSNVVLRGAKTSGTPYLPNADASATTFRLGSNGAISFGSGGSQTRGSSISITAGYTKGSTSLTLASVSGITTGTWLFLSEDPDPEIPVTKTGRDGDCTWCGWDDDTGNHPMNQLVTVTAPPSGNTVTINRPLYYTFKASLNPVARTLTVQVTKAGFENIRLDGSAADHGAFIGMTNSLYCWVKGVETYLAGSASKAAHIITSWSQGNEIRDSYFHYGRNFSSDKNYGIYFLFVNSDHKIENNIARVQRHAIALEGGGSGLAFLYNYFDDVHEDDLTYFGAALMNHGAHPYMNLYEGNIASHLIADNYWGTSSHQVLFRNWLWGDETQPQAAEWLYPAGALTKPNWGFMPLEIWSQQHYFAAVGNVLGVTGKWQNPNWASYGLLANGCSSPDSMYNYGCSFNSGSSPDSSAYSTSINHGNWDYKTRGVAYWDGGSDHTLRNSMYYTSKPTFFGGCAWPPFGPEGNPSIGTLPAKARFDGDTSCGTTSAAPNPPTGLTATVK